MYAGYIVGYFKKYPAYILPSFQTGVCYDEKQINERLNHEQTFSK